MACYAFGGMQGTEDGRVVVVGAGIAGLAAAGTLARAGREVLVLERARGVGGRAATRRFEGQPVDFGVMFYHGRDAGFLAALAEVPASPCAGWPAEIRGAGRACQPEAFAPGEKRLAFAEGVSAFPKHLAEGLTVRTEVRVTSLGPAGEGVTLTLEAGEPIQARTVVLAMAGDQAAALLGTWPAGDRGIDGARAVLGMVPTEPCLSLTALYDDLGQAPAWHAYYPEDSRIVQVIGHDSSKRRDPKRLALVFQAHARFSRESLEDPGWPDLVLDEAARLLGPWAKTPSVVHPHRWKFARTNLGAELAAPLVIHAGTGATIGLAGEVFSPRGGSEAAWLSGRALGRSLVEEGR